MREYHKAMMELHRGMYDGLEDDHPHKAFHLRAHTIHKVALSRIGRGEGDVPIGDLDGPIERAVTDEDLRKLVDGA
jgi:hypothetical protein